MLLAPDPTARWPAAWRSMHLSCFNRLRPSHQGTPLTVEADLALAALHIGHSHRILLAAESLDGLQQGGRCERSGMWSVHIRPQACIASCGTGLRATAVLRRSRHDGRRRRPAAGALHRRTASSRSNSAAGGWPAAPPPQPGRCRCQRGCIPCRRCPCGSWPLLTTVRPLLVGWGASGRPQAHTQRGGILPGPHLRHGCRAAVLSNGLTRERGRCGAQRRPWAGHNCPAGSMDMGAQGATDRGSHAHSRAATSQLHAQRRPSLALQLARADPKPLRLPAHPGSAAAAP